jgi:hypothetical protein
MQFAAYDSEKVIWGTGETEEAAMLDARHWLGLNHEDGSEVLGTLTVDQCTDDLANSVKNRGGQISWEWSGTLNRYMQLSGE